MIKGREIKIGERWRRWSPYEWDSQYKWYANKGQAHEHSQERLDEIIEWAKEMHFASVDKGLKMKWDHHQVDSHIIHQTAAAALADHYDLEWQRKFFDFNKFTSVSQDVQPVVRQKLWAKMTIREGQQDHWKFVLVIANMFQRQYLFQCWKFGQDIRKLGKMEAPYDGTPEIFMDSRTHGNPMDIFLKTEWKMPAAVGQDWWEIQ